MLSDQQKIVTVNKFELLKVIFAIQKKCSLHGCRQKEKLRQDLYAAVTLLNNKQKSRSTGEYWNA